MERGKDVLFLPEDELVCGARRFQTASTQPRRPLFNVMQCSSFDLCSEIRDRALCMLESGVRRGASERTEYRQRRKIREPHRG